MADCHRAVWGNKRKDIYFRGIELQIGGDIVLTTSALEYRIQNINFIYSRKSNKLTLAMYSSINRHILILRHVT